MPLFGLFLYSKSLAKAALNASPRSCNFLEGGEKGGGGGGSRSLFTENKTVLSQFTKNKIGISRFTEKNEHVFFKHKLHTATF